jgi:methionyl-tRNA synthetase
MFSQKNYFITTELPQVNNEPHIGDIISSVLSGDIYARYRKAQGYNVVHLCGTNDYGSATTIKTKIEELTHEQICDKYHDKHKNIYDWFNIQFDIWGRTATKEHAPITQEFFLQLYKNGYIEEKELVQLYCKKCNVFLTDRYVKGICYHDNCKNKNSIANGHQCDICHNIIDAEKLINPYCFVCKNDLQASVSKHLFLKLSCLSNNIKNYLETKANINSQILEIVKIWLNNKPISKCITTDLDWGIPIPQGIDNFLDGYKNKVFNVWFDALFGHYSILAKEMPQWREYLASDNLEWVSVQTKDNLLFHTIYFIGSVLGSKLAYPLIDQIYCTEHLLSFGKKITKRENIGLFGNNITELSNKLGINEDYWRFYLVKIRPETHDRSFCLADFVSTIKTDLINNIGNFIHECFSLTTKYCNNKTPIVNKDNLKKYVSKYETMMNEFRFCDALRLCLELGTEGNNYIRIEQPCIKAKYNMENANKIIGRANTICWLLLKLLVPFIPRTANNILSHIKYMHNSFEFNGQIDLPFKRVDLDEIEAIIHKK